MVYVVIFFTFENVPSISIALLDLLKPVRFWTLGETLIEDGGHVIILREEFLKAFITSSRSNSLLFYEFLILKIVQFLLEDFLGLSLIIARQRIVQLVYLKRHLFQFLNSWF